MINDYRLDYVASLRFRTRLRVTLNFRWQKVGLHVGHATPEVVTCFGIECLELSKQLGHATTIRGMLVRTVFLLFLIFVQFGKTLYLLLLDAAEGADDGHVKLVHLECRWHSRESPLEGHVHE